MDETRAGEFDGINREFGGVLMQLTVLGSGDAFGSGGRLQTGFHIARATGDFLIDCGATSLLSMFRFGLDPGRVGTIFVSHLHGDHFAGLAWWLIHAVHISKRQAPLNVVGPPGLKARFETLTEAVYPGALAAPRGFALNIVEIDPGDRVSLGDVTCLALEVLHSSGAPPLGFRFELEGKVIAFSGDTEWVENLVTLASGADLFICECTAYAAVARLHLNWRTIEANLSRIGAKRVLLSHLGPDSLAHLADMKRPGIDTAEDGLVIAL